MVTRGLTKADGSSSRALSGEVRYPPTAQQFAGVRLKDSGASLSRSGRLRISSRICHLEPLILGPAVRACRSLKGVACLRGLSSLKYRF